MSAASNAGEVAILTHLATQYDEIALSTADPGEDGLGIAEPVGNGYARIVPSWDTPVSGAPSSMTNDVDLEFATATGSWGTITHIALYVSGVLHWSQALVASAVITSGDEPKLAAGALVVTVD